MPHVWTPSFEQKELTQIAKHPEPRRARAISKRSHSPTPKSYRLASNGSWRMELFLATGNSTKSTSSLLPRVTTPPIFPGFPSWVSARSTCRTSGGKREPLLIFRARCQGFRITFVSSVQRMYWFLPWVPCGLLTILLRRSDRRAQRAHQQRLARWGHGEGD